MPLALPLRRHLKSGILVELDVMYPHEQAAVRDLFNAVIIEGKTYPHCHPLSEAEFLTYWMSGDTYVVRRPDTPSIALTESGERSIVYGAFFLKPNFPGRCSHICNAGFIVQSAMRGRGIGRFMGEVMLDLAIDRGYAAVMFNPVFATNIQSLNLWKSLGFTAIGHIPKAAHLSEGQQVDAFILYRSLR